MTGEIEFKTTIDFRYGEPKEVAPGIRRIVASNPGPFTFKGTNTYLVGTTELAAIDPGPDDPAHRDALLEAAGKHPIRHILLTHTHLDHLEGLPALQQATGARTYGYGRMIDAAARGPCPSGGERGEVDFRPDVVLRDGDTMRWGGHEIRALHTPGHAPDHLCFALEGTGVLFSGDHVMAWSTSVIAPPEGRMADYMRSLERLRERGETDLLYLPGHGGRLEQPIRMVRAFIVHRLWREQAILDAIRDGHSTITRIVGVVYRDLDARLVRAAALSVQAHVENLIERGLVASEQPLTPDCRLSPV
jgi:glyoxylase-like metal-dependent hydrolase (beta-lactamase superfamily II)